MKRILLYLFLAVLITILSIPLWIYIFPEYTYRKIVELERNRAGLKLYKIEVNGHKIVYLTGGKGENLILLHGFGANKDNWTRVSKFLTPHFKITAPDLTGFGDSDKPSNISYSIESQMERVIDFANKLGIKNFHLGGSSMGGYISAALTAKYRDRVKSLWLIAPGGVFSSKDSDMITMVRKGMNPLIADDLESFRKIFSFVFYKKPIIPEPFIKVMSHEAISNSELNRLIFKELINETIPAEKMLEGCTIPTLILWGSDDRVLHRTGAEILRKKMINAKTVVLEKTGHLPMIENPERSAEIFLRFHRKPYQ